MDYFGCIPQDKFELLSKEEQTNFLLSKNIYTTINVISLTQGGWTPLTFNDTTQKHVPIKIVETRFYEFVVAHYAEYITQQFYNFYIDFNEKKYGLKASKQKKLALKYFKSYYEHVATKAIAIVTKQNLENGGIIIKNIPKIEFLKEQQRTLESELSNTELLQQFLFGNKDYFVATRINEFKILNEVIDFEVALSILLSLNGQYHFEKDGYISKSDLKKDPNNSNKVSENNPNKKDKTLPSNTNKNPETGYLTSKKGLNIGLQPTDATKTITSKKIVEKRTLITDEEAIQYLIESVFSKN
mgnify:CR=1 FL=1